MGNKSDINNLNKIYSTLNEGFSDDPPFRKAIDEFCDKIAVIYRMPDTENKPQVLELYQLIKLWEAVYLITPKHGGKPHEQGSAEARGALNRFQKLVSGQSGT